MQYTLGELATIVGGEPCGGTDTALKGIAGIDEASATDVTFLTNIRYLAKLASSKAGAVLIPKDVGETPMPAIRCTNVDRAVARLFTAFTPPASDPIPGIHPTATVHDKAMVDGSATVGPNVTIAADVRVGPGTQLFAGVNIGTGVTIGENCVLYPNVVLRERCHLGNRVIIHANSVIGADGFGYYFDEGRHNKVPHIGGVRIEDDVEIGSCTCIDRAKFGFTIIGEGTKIDNLVQVAHNVRVGKHCVFAGLVGISGSVRIGDYCMFGGMSGSADNVTIGNQVIVSARAGVIKNTPDGARVLGFPAQEHMKAKRTEVALRKLPNLLSELKSLRARIEQLEASADDNA